MFNHRDRVSYVSTSKIFLACSLHWCFLFREHYIQRLYAVRVNFFRFWCPFCNSEEFCACPRSSSKFLCPGFSRSWVATPCCVCLNTIARESILINFLLFLWFPNTRLGVLQPRCNSVFSSLDQAVHHSALLPCLTRDSLSPGFLYFSKNNPFTRFLTFLLFQDALHLAWCLVS